MTADQPRVALRAVRPGDREFLAALYASTRTEELAAVPFTDAQRSAFLAQQFEAQCTHFETNHADAAYDVIEVDGRAAGRLIVNRSGEDILVVDVALVPEQRGRGIGTALMDAILAEADARGAKVVLHVEVFNRARSLYDRLGFAPVADIGPYVKMERQPAAASGEDGFVAHTVCVAADRHQEDLEPAELGMLERADALLEDRVGGTAEDEGERHAPSAVVGGRRAGRVGDSLDQLHADAVHREGVADQRGEGRDVDAIEHARDANRGLTRRRALQLGAVAGMSALWVGPSFARAAGSTTPSYLRRSSYAGLVGSHFAADGAALRLASVGDVAGAGADASLRGADEAFVLEFDGVPDALAGGTHSFSHRDLGSFDLFVAPVGEAGGGSQSYEVVVDRSVRTTARSAPQAPPPADPGPTPEQKQAAADELIAATPVSQIPGAPVTHKQRAPVRRKRRVRRRRRRVRHHRRPR